MIRVVTATEAKNRFGAIIKGAYLREEHLIVKRDGIPVVAIVPMADYQRLINAEDLPPEVAQAVAASSNAMHARSDLAAFLEQVHARVPDVPTEEVDRDIAEAVQQVRARA
ncbi:MAG: hypothetical protein NVS2B7_00970 [Herpetosiphon sp.]